MRNSAEGDAAAAQGGLGMRDTTLFRRPRGMPYLAQFALVLIFLFVFAR
jgi:hypothetical protein